MNVKQVTVLVSDLYNYFSTDWIVVFSNDEDYSMVAGDTEKELDDDDKFMYDLGYTRYTYNDLCHEQDKVQA